MEIRDRVLRGLDRRHVQLKASTFGKQDLSIAAKFQANVLGGDVRKIVNGSAPTIAKRARKLFV